MPDSAPTSPHAVLTMRCVIEGAHVILNDISKIARRILYSITNIGKRTTDRLVMIYSKRGRNASKKKGFPACKIICDNQSNNAVVVLLGFAKCVERPRKLPLAKEISQGVAVMRYEVKKMLSIIDFHLPGVTGT